MGFCNVDSVKALHYLLSRLDTRPRYLVLWLEAFCRPRTFTRLVAGAARNYAFADLLESALTLMLDRFAYVRSCSVVCGPSVYAQVVQTLTSDCSKVYALFGSPSIFANLYLQAVSILLRPLMGWPLCKWKCMHRWFIICDCKEPSHQGFLYDRRLIAVFLSECAFLLC